MKPAAFEGVAVGVVAARQSFTLRLISAKTDQCWFQPGMVAKVARQGDRGWNGSYAYSNPIWGNAERRHDGVAMSKTQISDSTVPDVTGMGAKDAVFLLETYGLRVKLQGRGKVKRQSIPAGSAIVKNGECVLTLE